ncbi:MAG: hypothetical protein WDA09_08835 [Bacteriovoracaceae bacterium]
MGELKKMNENDSPGKSHEQMVYEMGNGVGEIRSVPEAEESKSSDRDINSEVKSDILTESESEEEGDVLGEEAQRVSLGQYKDKLSEASIDRAAIARQREIIAEEEPEEQSSEGFAYAEPGLEKARKERLDREFSELKADIRDEERTAADRARQRLDADEKAGERLASGQVAGQDEVVVPFVSSEEYSPAQKEEIKRNWGTRVEDDLIAASRNEEVKGSFEPRNKAEEREVLKNWEQKAANMDNISANPELKKKPWWQIW